MPSNSRLCQCPVSQLWAPSDSKFTHLETGADKNSARFSARSLWLFDKSKKIGFNKAKRQIAGIPLDRINPLNNLRNNTDSANASKLGIAAQH